MLSPRPGATSLDFFFSFHSHTCPRACHTQRVIPRHHVLSPPSFVAYEGFDEAQAHARPKVTGAASRSSLSQPSNAMTQGKLEGLVALVTGASTGIGKATAISLSKEGAKVVIAARGEDKLKEVADEITSAGGEAVVVAGDIFKEADCKMMVDTAVEKFGALHVAFNNTGVFETATFADMTKDSVDSLPDNAKSLARCFKYQV
ncbi:unnamed protein product [Ectocarpus fasciculatus]